MLIYYEHKGLLIYPYNRNFTVALILNILCGECRLKDIENMLKTANFYYFAVSSSIHTAKHTYTRKTIQIRPWKCAVVAYFYLDYWENIHLYFCMLILLSLKHYYN